MTITTRIRQLAISLLLATSLGSAFAAQAAATHHSQLSGAHPNAQPGHHYVPDTHLGPKVHI